MKSGVISNRYGEALFALAKENDAILPWQRQLEEVEQVFLKDHDFAMLLENKSIPYEKKKEILQAVFANQIDSGVLHFLFLLVDKERQDFFHDIILAYHQLVEDYYGIVKAKVTVALPLTKEEEVNLAAALEKRLSAKVQLEITIDPAIIGGMRVQVGDTVYDGSLSHQLDEIAQRLMK